ncbi:hypothetical protein LguiA_033578 [Lonicera macranthoides]
MERTDGMFQVNLDFVVGLFSTLMIDGLVLAVSGVGSMNQCKNLVTCYGDQRWRTMGVSKEQFGCWMVPPKNGVPWREQSHGAVKSFYSPKMKQAPVKMFYRTTNLAEILLEFHLWLAVCTLNND